MMKEAQKRRIPVMWIACLFVLTTAIPMVSSAVTYSPSINTSYLSYYIYYRTIGYIISLAGRDLNGTSLNGDILDGEKVVSVSLDNVEIDDSTLTDMRLRETRFFGHDRVEKEGSTLTDTKLRETRFFGHDDNGSAPGSRGFIGAVFTATLTNGATLPLRIDAMERLPEKENKDVYAYDVFYRTDTSWEPLCGLDENGDPVQAIPVNGFWDLREGVPGGGAKIEDDSSFTFACRGFAIAKCVEAGYKPWKEGKICTKGRGGCQTVSLADHHQACTRMLRADYCGDGSSHTEDDEEISFFDAFGIRTDSEDWTFEAEWDADGAICLTNERIPSLAPSCKPYLVDEECGAPAHLTEGALLFSEIAPLEE